MIYTADWIVTQDAARTVVRDGAILVRGDSVAAVGAASDVVAANPGEQTVSLGESAVFPGLVDAHCHLPMSLLRGRGDDKPLFAWLNEDVFPREAKLFPEAVRLGAALSCCELARYGCTSFFDMYMLEENVFAAADEVDLWFSVGTSFRGLSRGLFPERNRIGHDGYLRHAMCVVHG